MTPEAQRIAIAEACSHDCTELKMALDYFKDRDAHPESLFLLNRVPDYLNDLNAMHEAEKVLTDAQRVEYHYKLSDVVVGKFTWETSAAQRAEAFLRTLGLWKEDNNERTK